MEPIALICLCIVTVGSFILGYISHKHANEKHYAGDLIISSDPDSEFISVNFKTNVSELSDKGYILLLIVNE